MEEDSGWTPPYHSQQRPVSLPVDYEIESPSTRQQHSKPCSSSRLFRPSRPHPLQTATSSMPIPIPTNPNVIPGNNLPSAPASPPTPAPSPSPKQRAPDWSTASAHEDLGVGDDDDDEEDMIGSQGTFHPRSRSSRGAMGLGYRHIRHMFAEMDNEGRKRLLAEMLNMCDGKLLGFVAGFVGPRLKRDPFGVLPNELCLRVSPLMR